MIRHRKGLSFSGTLLFASLSVCLPCGDAQAGDTVRIGGNGSGLGAMKLLAKAYRETHPKVTITVAPSLGSSGGIAALRDGALDLAVSARPLRAEEQGDGTEASEYASTPFIFTAHRKVPKAGLTTDELISMYRQETTKWPDGTRIRLILRPQNDTDTAFVKRISPAMDRAVQRAQARPGMMVATTDQESADAITRLPGALGGSTLTEIVTEARAVNMLAYNGVKPTLRNLSDGSYPLVKKLYLVTTAKTSAQARQFAAYLRSAKARAILAKSGNLTPTPKER